jgi:hypothetical protein
LGWYPIPTAVFDIMREAPETMGHRDLIVPLRQLSEQGNAIYLFNVSILRQLKKTALSEAIFSKFVEDLARLRMTGLAGVCVSEEGARFARRFGLIRTGTVLADGEVQIVYAKRSTDPRPECH